MRPNGRFYELGLRPKSNDIILLYELNTAYDLSR